MSDWDRYWIMADAKPAARPAQRPAPRPRWARILRTITGLTF